jgi:hypothetical protein
LTPIIHFFLHVLGIDGTGYWANFWDGFGSGPIAWVFLPAVYYFHHICHENHCYRMGHPNTEGRVICKQHIPLKEHHA